jgi:hypothetical protein
MTYRLFVTQEATKDADAGYEWYERNQNGLGKKFFDEIDRHFVRILQSPMQFPLNKNERISVMGKFPYKIVFSIHDDLIVIHSIYHDKRDPGKL